MGYIELLGEFSHKQVWGYNNICDSKMAAQQIPLSNFLEKDWQVSNDLYKLLLHDSIFILEMFSEILALIIH